MPPVGANLQRPSEPRFQLPIIGRSCQAESQIPKRFRDTSSIVSSHNQARQCVDAQSALTLFNGREIDRHPQLSDVQQRDVIGIWNSPV